MARGMTWVRPGWGKRGTPGEVGDEAGDVACGGDRK